MSTRGFAWYLERGVPVGEEDQVLHPPLVMAEVVLHPAVPVVRHECAASYGTCAFHPTTRLRFVARHVCAASYDTCALHRTSRVNRVAPFRLRDTGATCVRIYVRARAHVLTYVCVRAFAHPYTATLPSIEKYAEPSSLSTAGNLPHTPLHRNAYAVHRAACPPLHRPAVAQALSRPPRADR